MKFHKEVANYFKGSRFNKNKAKIFVISGIIIYLILGAFNIYWYSLNQRTVKVVATKGTMYANQRITKQNTQEYLMTYKEYLRYGVQNTKEGIKNKIVKYEDLDKIIGLYSAYPKSDYEFLRWDQIVNTHVDYSRTALYSHPGKTIVPLDINASNLNTFKKTLQVGDKINIKYTYDLSASVNLTAQADAAKRKTGDVTLTGTKDLFTGIEVVDILNSKGESLLDYYNYLNHLPQATKEAIENTDEYAKKTQVSSIYLALTPQQNREYMEAKTQANTMFYIDLPQLDES